METVQPLSFTEILDRQREKIRFLEERNRWLEFRLKQKVVESRKDFHSMSPFFDSQKKKILENFWSQVDPTGGMTMAEVISAFSKNYPEVPTSNLGRRVYELRESNQLWSAPDPETGLMKFYLTFKKMPGEEST